VHELSLCRSIHGIVARAAGGRPVVRVDLDVGQLRQVVPQTLQHCWGFVTAGGPLEGAELAVASIPGRLECAACGAGGEIGPGLGLRCPACGSSATRVAAGEEFLVRSIDVKDPDAD
jgi:hydrogenase nickel incorporation protein HypA/HybF